MRILHILDHSAPLHSGYAFRTLAILREQRALGWDTVQLTGPKQGLCAKPEQTVDGWHFFRTEPARGLGSRLPLLKQLSLVNSLARRLHQVAKLTRPDVLHAHSPALNAIAALRVGRMLGLPVVYEIRAFWEDAAVDHGTSAAGGIRYRLSRALETFAVRHADQVTTICEGLRADLCARGIGVQKVTVIPNAVDLDHFSDGQPRDAALARQLGLGTGPTLGFIGSFYAYEGLTLLLEAMPLMLAACPALHLLLVGGGVQQAALKALALRLGIADKVIFTGRVPHAQVARYYDLIDVLVYPRLPMRLTELVTPLKPLEAMAQGRLIVASDVGGHRELIAHGRTGILFQAGNRESLAEKVLGLFRHPECWQALRLAARAYVETERNWYASVARYAAIYARLPNPRVAP